MTSQKTKKLSEKSLQILRKICWYSEGTNASLSLMVEFCAVIIDYISKSSSLTLDQLFGNFSIVASELLFYLGSDLAAYQAATFTLISSSRGKFGLKIN